MLFCKKKKQSMCLSPLLSILAVSGIAVALFLKKKGKVAKDAMMQAGKTCSAAARDAAEEIMGE